MITSQTPQIVTLYNGSTNPVYSVYPANVVSALNGGFYPSSNSTPNAWLWFNNLGGTFGLLPSLNALYAVQAIGLDAANNQTIYMTDLQGPYGPIVTPSSFTDHPNQGAFALEGYIQNPSGNYTGTSGLLLGDGWFSFGGLPTGVGSGGNNVSAPDMYMTATFPQPNSQLPTGTAYKGATGTDGIGNIFLSGLCVTIGDQGSGNFSTDGGSDW